MGCVCTRLPFFKLPKQSAEAAVGAAARGGPSQSRHRRAGSFRTLLHHGEQRARVVDREIAVAWGPGPTCTGREACCSTAQFSVWKRGKHSRREHAGPRLPAALLAVSASSTRLTGCAEHENALRAVKLSEQKQRDAKIKRRGTPPLFRP